MFRCCVFNALLIFGVLCGWILTSQAAPLLSVGSTFSSQLPTALKKAQETAQTGDFAAAEKQVRAFLENVPDNATAHDLLAQLLLTQDQLDEAEEAAKTSIKRAPAGVDNRVTLASILQAKGDTQGAEAVLQKAVQLDPKAVLPRSAYAELAVASGDSAKAASRYRAIIDGGLVPDDQLTQVHARTVDLLAGIENHAAVVDLLTPLAKRLMETDSPQAVPVALRLMQAQVAEDDLSAAEKTIRNTLPLVPVNRQSDLLHEAVDFYFAADRQDESVTLLKNLLSGSPAQTSLPIRVLLAETQGAAGDAVGGLKTLAVIDPLPPPLKAVRANLHWTAQDADAAIADLEAVVAASPNAVPVWMQLYSYLHQVEGHDVMHTRSRMVLERARRANGQDVMLTSTLAELEWEEDNAAKAIALHEEILTTDPNALDSIARVGRWQASQPDGLQKAQVIIGAADPNNPAALQVRAVIDLHAGRVDQARDALMFLRERVPSNPAITLDLARAEQARGNTDDAVQLATRALQIGLFADDGRVARNILTDARGDQQTTVDVFAIGENGNGAQRGSITVTDTENGLRVTPDLSNMPSGTLGFHVHAHGSCDPAMMEGIANETRVAGMAAGMHFDVDLQLPEEMRVGRHPLGDLPYLKANENGSANQPVTAPQLRLSWIRGKAVMIHAGPDGPFGDSASRIACGIIPKR